MNIVNRYPRVTNTGNFYTHLLMRAGTGIIVFIPMDTRTRYTVIKLKND